MSQQLFFYCNAVPDDLRAALKLSGDSPAATRKVIGLCRACRSVGIDAQIVTMGRGKVESFGFFGAQQREIEGVPAHIGPMLHIPVLSHALSALWIAWMALKLSRSHARQVHLFYNQLTFYLPALIILRLLGKFTAVDIEDGPITTIALEDSLAKARVGSNVPPAIFAKFISGGALLANARLGDSTPVRPTMPYYGAVQSGPLRVPPSTPDVTIAMTGTLEVATGTDLLVDALRLIDQHSLSKSFTVIVTGSGSGEARLREAAHELVRVRINVLGRVDRDQYDAIIRNCDVGLSLKLLDLSYSDTTFPSKTLEYAENGLLLITTDISDVRAVFGDSAWYLTANDPQQLANLILRAAADPSEVRALGLRGQQLVNDRFSFEKAGAELAAFFFGARR